MKINHYSKLAFLLFLGLTIINCGQGPKEEAPSSQAESTEVAPAPPPKPQITEKYQLEEEMNPLNVYKDKTKVFADSLNVQFYELILEPGDSIGLHGHLDHTVYVLQGGSAMVWVNGTDPVPYELPTGYGFLDGPLADAAKNTGDTTIRLLITEIYRPRME